MATLQTGLNETEEDRMPAMINNFRPPVPLYERNVKLFDGERTKTYDEQKSKGEGSVKELKKGKYQRLVKFYSVKELIH